MLPAFRSVDAPWKRRSLCDTAAIPLNSFYGGLCSAHAMALDGEDKAMHKHTILNAKRTEDRAAVAWNASKLVSVCHTFL